MQERNFISLVIITLQFHYLSNGAICSSYNKTAEQGGYFYQFDLICIVSR